MKRIHPTTTILTCRFSFVLVLVSLFLATTGHALDFYGATITDRELPTSFFKLNMYGIRPIVDHVTTDSPADKFGLRQGDVILSINGKSIAKASDFSTLIKEKNEIRIIRGLARKRITATRVTIEAAKQLQHAAHKTQEPAPKPSTPPASDMSPAIRFDDAALEKRFGKTTPAQREALRQQNQQRMQQEEADAAAETARKQQEALDEQRRAAEKEAARQRWIENQRIERNRLRQQQLNEMQEKIDRLEREKSKRATETK
jgi:membrane-associated protease RseP (regulator of RpoE activity)